MDNTRNKRKGAPDQRDGSANKKSRQGKKNWDMPRKAAVESRSIQPGEMGIWATCAMKKEAPSTTELRTLFEEYASQLYEEDQISETAETQDSDEESGDIENEIKKEIEGIRKPATDPLFKSVHLSTACLVFFKTRSPVEPVSFVRKICQDAAEGKKQSNCRFVKRLTPITLTDKATERGLEDVARKVLAPHFHEPDQGSKKFAIRVTIRNNKQFTRDSIIKTVASLVGKGHKVDLSGYDLLILVEVYQNILGMSVVGSDYDELKRYNLAEITEMTRSGDDEATKGSSSTRASDQPAIVTRVVEETNMT
ncbi:THUMP domain-containing protein [Periconia macrospinosa]|uniref:THUMP domain-containing protein n=1 Tax=Periconia macrospinosa TaxID=97972 RepID=A0A2V1DJB6_9PLEO|nr:THUMP domain-containing protein [Periconia macrospinosa]